MRFWDSSAVVPLLVPEATSRPLQELYDADPVMVVWWATELECTSAMARRQRFAQLSEAIANEGSRRLSALRTAWHEVEPGEDVREMAKRLLRVHDLRTAHALQLAAALFAAEGRPPTLEVVSLDDRLVNALRREGFSTAPAVGGAR